MSSLLLWSSLFLVAADIDITQPLDVAYLKDPYETIHLVWRNLDKVNKAIYGDAIFIGKPMLVPETAENASISIALYTLYGWTIVFKQSDCKYGVYRPPTKNCTILQEESNIGMRYRIGYEDIIEVFYANFRGAVDPSPTTTTPTPVKPVAVEEVTILALRNAKQFEYFLWNNLEKVNEKLTQIVNDGQLLVPYKVENSSVLISSDITISWNVVFKKSICMKGSKPIYTTEGCPVYSSEANIDRKYIITYDTLAQSFTATPGTNAEESLLWTDIEKINAQIAGEYYYVPQFIWAANYPNLFYVQMALTKCSKRFDKPTRNCELDTSVTGYSKAFTITRTDNNGKLTYTVEEFKNSQ